MNRQSFYDHVFYTTVRITSSSVGGSGNSIGTGFIISAKFKADEPAGCTLLVSNRHVLRDPSGKISMQFHKLADDGQSPKLTETIPVELSDFGAFYKEHPDPDVDLACVNISLIRQVEPTVFFRTLRFEDLASLSEADLFAGREVLFAGYPENRFDTVHNLPLLRAGYIASLPTVDFNGRRQLVIDAQVFPGSSGSPVFTELEGVIKLLGVVSATMIRHGQLQNVPPGLGLTVKEVIGLGLVVKAIALRELIVMARDEAEVNYKHHSGAA